MTIEDVVSSYLVWIADYFMQASSRNDNSQDGKVEVGKITSSQDSDNHEKNINSEIELMTFV